MKLFFVSNWLSEQLTLPLSLAEYCQDLVDMELYETIYHIWRQHCEGSRHREPVCQVFGAFFTQAALPVLSKSLLPRAQTDESTRRMQTAMREVIEYMIGEARKPNSELWSPRSRLYAAAGSASVPAEQSTDHTASADAPMVDQTAAAAPGAVATRKRNSSTSTGGAQPQVTRRILLTQP